jgi:hypothetical protein
MKHLAGLLIACLALAGCATGKSYEGAKLPEDEVGRIVGDYRFTAGIPVSVILLKVDDYEVPVSQHAVDVLPGTHTILVDCRVAETRSVSRFTLEAEVYEGERYRLVPQTGPAMRSCSAVTLEAD